MLRVKDVSYCQLKEGTDTHTHLSSSVDVSDGVADGHGTDHLIVEEGVESSDGTREARSNRCVRCYRHWLHPSLLGDQE